jgi:hypothetical protein
MSDAAAEPYEALAALSEHELELVAVRDFDAIGELKRAREALVATLPAVPPPSAGAALTRCWQLNQRVRIELLRVREAIILELDTVRRGQRAANGYQPHRKRSSLRIDANA